MDATRVQTGPARPERRRWLARMAGTLATAGLGIPAGAGAAGSQRVPVPVLPKGPIELRVAHLVNPRLPRMDAGQLRLLLDALRGATLEHLGVELRFAPLVELPIGALFATIPPARRDEAMADVFDFKTGRGDVRRLEQAFARGFRTGGESLREMAAYAVPHVGPVPEAGFEGFGARMARIQLERIARWRAVAALDGKPVIDAQPFNEFALWLALGHGDVPFELLLTNQIIASVEYSQPAVHSAVRGGYTNGVTTYGRVSRFQTFSVWSTFAFTSEDEWVRGMRGGESYSHDEAARLAGIAAAHELGHQLFHYLHPFGRTACLMNPVPMFGYRAWAAALSARDCPAGSHKAMKPGAAKFLY